MKGPPGSEYPPESIRYDQIFHGKMNCSDKPNLRWTVDARSDSLTAHLVKSIEP